MRRGETAWSRRGPRDGVELGLRCAGVLIVDVKTARCLLFINVEAIDERLRLGDLPHEDLALLTLRDTLSGQDWEGHIAGPAKGGFTSER